MKKIVQIALAIPLIALLFTGTSLNAQNIGINATGAAPSTGAMLDVSATNKGVLIPRVNIVNLATIAPITGVSVTSLLVYNTNATTGAGYYYWEGTKWIKLTTQGEDWSLTGNSNVSFSNFLGPTNNASLNFRTNNIERMRILSAGQVAINSTALLSTEKLHVAGGTTYGIRTDNTSASDVIWAQNNGNGDGVHGSAYGTGDAVYGYAGGSGYGVYGYSSTGTGVRGYGNGSTVFGGSFFNGNTSGTGLIATGNNMGGSYLVSGTGIAANGYDGIFAYGKNALGTGVIGVGNNQASILTFSSGGGGAFTGNKNGIAAYAKTTSSTSYAVYGQYDGGVADGKGVYGWAYPTFNWGYGVYGYGGWYSVFANGDLGASGIKAFMIDDPRDPENKFLRHFSIESNEVLNVYRGNVVLDNNGKAVVQLPEYFHLININFSYNLTPIGAPAQLYILREINKNGQFTIAGGNSGQKISWYVYAERNDPYLQKYPEKKQVEIEKTGERKGKYLMPELYGQPAEKGYDSKTGNTKEIKAKTIKEETKKVEK